MMFLLLFNCCGVGELKGVLFVLLGYIQLRFYGQRLSRVVACLGIDFLF